VHSLIQAYSRDQWNSRRLLDRAYVVCLTDDRRTISCLCVRLSLYRSKTGSIYIYWEVHREIRDGYGQDSHVLPRPKLALAHWHLPERHVHEDLLGLEVPNSLLSFQDVDVPHQRPPSRS
jgi:hypothetical protein